MIQHAETTIEYGADAPTRGVRAARLRSLYSSIPLSIIIGGAVVALLVFVHLPIRPVQSLMIWAGAYAVIALARLAALLIVRRTRDHHRHPERWMLVFAVLTVLGGLLWGATAIVLLRPESSPDQAILMFVIAGLTAGGVVNLAGSWPLAWLFMVASLGPFLVRFAGPEFGGSGPMLVMMVIYMLAMMSASVRLARDTEFQIRSRFKLREEAEKRQREQAIYRTLVESTAAVLWEADAETLTFQYVSPEVEGVLGYTPEEWLADPDFWSTHIHPEDRDWVVSYCQREARARRSHSMEYRMRARDGSTVWLRDTVNVVRDESGATRLVGSMLDVTDQHLAARRLEYASGLQRLMVDASREFIQSSQESLDRTLTTTLERVGRWCEVDRAYLIRFTDDLSSYSNTHEWVADGITAEMGNLQDMPSTTIPHLMDRLKRHEPVVISSVAELGSEWHEERAIFDEENIRSLITLPVVSGDRLIGLVGFDSVRHERVWSDRESALLQVLGDLIGAAIGRNEVESRLRSSEGLRQHAESLAGMGSWQWEIGSERFEASEEWRNVVGVGGQTLTRTNVLALTPDSERARVAATLAETVETGAPYSIEHRIIRPDNGEARWIKVYADLVEGSDGVQRLCGFAQDITDRKQDAEALFRLAHYDSLTGLPNRVLALDRLEQSLRHARRVGTPVAVLFLDLDHFKKVNDTLGHAVGDRILKEAATRLLGQLREEDTVARIGGDEFLILLDDNINERDLVTVTQKLLQAFRKPFTLEGREIMLTASIGVAVSPQDGESGDELMRNADTAMYHAKNEGRNGFQYFTAAMNEDVSRQLELEEALRLSLGRDELALVYQPIVRVEDGQTVAVEALLRWKHPVLGDVSPAEFIPLAEHVGLIDRIGAFVIETGLTQLAHWHAAGYEGLGLSINVSPRQFRDEALAQDLLLALEEHGLPPSAISLEITEGTLLSGAEPIQATMHTLRDSGVGVVMDDFGTGFSSLGYLRDHPFDALKIDRRFVRDIEHNPADLQLVASAIRLGHALGMDVIAEGVENEKQLEMLAAEGCPLAQGFYLGRPMPPADFERFMAPDDKQADSR